MKVYYLKGQEWRDWSNLDARNALCERLKAEYGDVVLRRAGSSQSLKVIRTTAVTTVDRKYRSAAPHPDSCNCTQFTGREPGHHHPICVHRQQWELENPEAPALPQQPPAVTSQVTAETGTGPECPPAAPTSPHAMPGTLEGEEEDTDVDGRRDTEPPTSFEVDPDEKWLIDVSGKRVRPALVNEIEEANEKMVAEGVAAIELGGESYMVV